MGDRRCSPASQEVTVMFFLFDPKVMAGERDPAVYSVLFIMPMALFGAFLAPLFFIPEFPPVTKTDKK